MFFHIHIFDKWGQLAPSFVYILYIFTLLCIFALFHRVLTHLYSEYGIQHGCRSQSQGFHYKFNSILLLQIL
jgi:hypothetical protein